MSEPCPHGVLRESAPDSLTVSRMKQRARLFHRARNHAQPVLAMDRRNAPHLDLPHQSRSQLSPPRLTLTYSDPLRGHASPCRTKPDQCPPEPCHDSPYPISPRRTFAYGTGPGLSKPYLAASRHCLPVLTWSCHIRPGPIKPLHTNAGARLTKDKRKTS